MAAPGTFSWATDANYTAPGQTWDGTPTKVAPSVGQQTDGSAPKDKLSAQILNYLLNLLGAWTAYIAAGDTEQIALGSGPGDSIVCPPGTAGVSKYYPIALPRTRKVTAIRMHIGQSVSFWQASTNYALGNRITNGTHVYTCAVAGMSSGAGVGPTGITSGQIDGGVTWNYVGETAGAQSGSVNVSLVAATDAGNTIVATSNLAVASPSLQDLLLTGLAVQAAAHTWYYLKLTDLGAMGSSSIFGAEYDWIPA